MANSLQARIRQETRDMAVARQHMSLWVAEGVEDYSCAIHSTGMSYWNAMGTALGFDAIGEMPAPQSGTYAFAGDDVRSDSVWFERGTHSPSVVVEFERYTRSSDEGKLIAKVDNLLLAHHRWDRRPGILVLAYWTKGLASLPNHGLLRSRVTGGFVTTAKERVEGTATGEVLFFQTVLQQAESNKWRLVQIVERGV
jgi:hypothetical protein